MDTIVKNGETYFRQSKLEAPTREDFFVATDEIKFGGIYQETGFFIPGGYEAALREHFDNCAKYCPNRAGYFCKDRKCKYPSCLTEKK